MTDDERSATLATSPRWSALTAFVARWYETPIGPGDGLDDAAIGGIEERLKRPLPPLVREWFALVGRRLQSTNQDQPELPRHLEVRDGRLPLWWEHHGNWYLDVELEGEASMATIRGETFGVERRAHVCDALLGMVLSDTVVAAWGGGPGPLGALRDAVVGGTCLTSDATITASVGALACLESSMSPHYDKQFGHARLLVRGFEGGWEWMAADVDAMGEAFQLFRVDRVGGPRHLDLHFDPLPTSARSFVERLTARQVELGARPRLTHYDHGSSRAKIELETSEPAAVLERVLAQLDHAGRSALRAVHRPPYVSRGIRIWPSPP